MSEPADDKPITVARCVEEARLWLEEAESLMAAAASVETRQQQEAPQSQALACARIEPREIALPHESDVVEFYGAPSRDPDYLGWFNFPCDDARLYTWDGDHLKDHTGDQYDDHRCHEKLVKPLESALRALWDVLGADRFHKEGWHVYAGCFCYRSKTGGSGLSIHSWGAAIDLTAWGTGLMTTACGFSPEGIAIMEAHGFLWGPKAWGMPGEYQNPQHPGLYYDAMHFQAAIPYLNSNSYYAREGLPSHIKRWTP